MAEPLVFLIPAAFVAGFLDSIVGGGGLVTVPALMVGFPTAPITTLLGTNKIVSLTGTSFAAGHFLRAGLIKPREVLVPVLIALAGAALGVATAYQLEGRYETWLRPAMLVVLVAVLLFTLARPALGVAATDRRAPRGATVVIAFALAFYDGVFGPGTGTLLAFLFVSVLGHDFLKATALAKSVNWASNAASVAIFVSLGSWMPEIALGMAAANGLGGALGARTAIARGARWIRWVFVGVVSALVARLAIQALA